jgi:hypothetical protein
VKETAWSRSPSCARLWTHNGKTGYEIALIERSISRRKITSWIRERMQFHILPVKPSLQTQVPNVWLHTPCIHEQFFCTSQRRPVQPSLQTHRPAVLHLPALRQGQLSITLKHMKREWKWYFTMHFWVSVKGFANLKFHVQIFFYHADQKLATRIERDIKYNRVVYSSICNK